MAAGSGSSQYAGPLLTPAGWLALLEPRLNQQCAAIKAPVDYYNGVHRLAFATAKFKQAFSRFFPPMANNWMKLVVEAPVGRLKVIGFRFDPDPDKASWELEADRDAWKIWQANDLDAGSKMAHLEAIKCGVSYALVAPPEEDGGEPVITIELASQVYVMTAPGNRRKRLAAIKRWVDEIDGYYYATIYTPTDLYHFRSVKKASKISAVEGIQWTRNESDPGGPNPIGVVPMVPIENMPDLVYGGRSDLEVAMPIQDAVNKLCLDMQVSSEFNSFPQRNASGWESAKDQQGNDVDPSVKLGNSRIITSPSKDTKFGTFEMGEVRQFIEPINMYIDHLAALTRTPAYYLKGQMANLSAEAIMAADGSLVDRCWDKIDGSLSNNWEEVMRVAFLAKGDMKRGKAVTAETLWKDPERKSVSQLTDAAVKQRAGLSVPLEMCWQMLGWSPEQIRQAKAMMNLPDQPPPKGSPNGGTGETSTPGGVVLPAGVSANGAGA